VTDGRVCACGCGASLAGRRVTVRYVSEQHRQRAYRRRLREAAKAAGLPVTLSLRTVQASNPTRNRSGDGPSAGTAQQRRRREGVSVYFPTVADAELAERMLAESLKRRTAVDSARALTAVRAALDRRRKTTDRNGR
jgi:hypothetical protein